MRVRSRKVAAVMGEDNRRRAVGTINHNFLTDEHTERAQIDALRDEYRDLFRVLCQRLDITPAQLAAVEPAMLLTVMVMRVFAALDKRVASLETIAREKDDLTT